MGKRDYQCTPWGNPTYNVFGWQRPCYLLQDGYTKTFRELMEETNWDNYGTGRNEKCADCMVHCGYEASAVEDTFGIVEWVCPYGQVYAAAERTISSSIVMRHSSMACQKAFRKIHV